MTDDRAMTVRREGRQKKDSGFRIPNSWQHFWHWRENNTRDTRRGDDEEGREGHSS